MIDEQVVKTGSLGINSNAYRASFSVSLSEPMSDTVWSLHPSSSSEEKSKLASESVIQKIYSDTFTLNFITEQPEHQNGTHLYPSVTTDFQYSKCCQRCQKWSARDASCFEYWVREVVMAHACIMAYFVNNSKLLSYFIISYRIHVILAYCWLGGNKNECCGYSWDVP